MQTRDKRPHAEIGGASSATIVTWFDAIPRDICTGIATSMHPHHLPLLVAVGIVRLPALERNDASEQRIVYDVRLIQWLSEDAMGLMALLRLYASCCELVPSVDVRRTMCTMVLKAMCKHNVDSQRCVFPMLVSAIHKHDNAIVDVYMPLKNVVTYQDSRNYQAIGTAAVLADNQHALETMLALGVDINMQVDSNGDSLLMFAVRSGRESIVRFLLDKGASTAASGSLLLCAATANNGCAIAKLLIDRGVDINASEPNDWSMGSAPRILRPILSRLIGANNAIARMLLLRGASIAPIYDRHGMYWSPLFSSIGVDDEEMTALLLTLGADPSDVLQRYESVAAIRQISDSHRTLLARALGDAYV